MNHVIREVQLLCVVDNIFRKVLMKWTGDVTIERNIVVLGVIDGVWVRHLQRLRCVKTT